MKKNLNLIIAAIVMMGFLMFWESFVMSRYNTAPPLKPNVATPVAVSENVRHEKMSPAEEKAVLSLASQTYNPEEETLTVLESAGSKASFMSRGARVVSWKIQERDHEIELVFPEQFRVVSPLQTFPEINFRATKKSESQVSFVGVLPSGIIVTKDIQLFAKAPFHAVNLSFSNPTKSEQTVLASLPLGNGLDKHEAGLPYDVKAENGVKAENRALGLAARLKTWKPGFIFGRTIDMADNDKFQWVGIDNYHFLSALLPNGDFLLNAKVLADRTHAPTISVPLEIKLQPGETVRKNFNLYMGSKDYRVMEKMGFGLDQSVDFGIFGWIAKMLLKALHFFESMTGNYGWAIIILTFFIQILVFPLTRKNLQHAAKMREFQPHIQKIREQYKNDPKRLQVETFNFYKKNGMKFMGMEGCFPMLLQLPVFFAFYSTLNSAYELRGAPWIFWIQDLGVYDPKYVLPILMGLGMFFQQKLTAVAMDPAQQKMMMFMPIIMTVMFVKLPAGLVLYWCVNSLTTIVLQLILGAPKKPPIPTVS